MNFVVPEPVPLDPPRGNVGALEELVEDVGGAAYRLTVLSTGLTGPAASAPGWLGRDASAAAVEVGAVESITRECSAAVGAAEQRLRLHHDLLREAVRQVAALEAEQQEDFSEVRRRLARIQYIQATELDNAPEGEALIADLRAGEAVRRRRHAALIDEVADDAAMTIRVLAEASSVVGGRGTRGDADRVLVYLAAELPGWGDAELTARAEAVATALLGAKGLLSPEERDSEARRALTLAASPAFAAAFLLELGRAGVQETLELLGDGVLGPGSALASLMATAFGAVKPGEDPDDPLAAVMEADYVDAADTDRVRDLVTYGMAAVLTASARLGSGGMSRHAVVTWARQILAHEHELADVPREFRDQPLTGTPVDPLTSVLEQLAVFGDSATAAAVLGERVAWPLLLARSWVDGGATLADVVALAGTDPGRNGDASVRFGLKALGAGLEDGDPDGWTVDRATAAAVAPALGDAVARHVTVATGVLGLGIEEDLSGSAGDILRGLGYLTIDEGAARAIGTALHDWVRGQPVPVELICAPLPLPAVVVPSAFLAVREYGQRLDYALHGFEEQAEAERRELTWDLTVGLATELVFKRAGPVAGVLEGFAAIAFDCDGTWDNGRDRGMHFDGDDAAAAVRAELHADPVVAEALAGQARTVFDRTGEALGHPKPPTPTERDLLGPVKDAVSDGVLSEVAERGTNEGKRIRVR